MIVPERLNAQVKIMSMSNRCIGYWTRRAFRRSFRDAKAYLSTPHWFAGSWQFVRANRAG
jgi:hypothetical protein